MEVTIDNKKFNVPELTFSNRNKYVVITYDGAREFNTEIKARICLIEMEWKSKFEEAARQNEYDKTFKKLNKNKNT